MPDTLKLTTLLERETLIVYGEGRLNYRSALTFKSEIPGWLAADAAKIIFDMKQVVQIDSAGIGLLAQTLNQAVARGLQFQVINTPPELLKIFELSGLSALLEKKQRK